MVQRMLVLLFALALVPLANAKDPKPGTPFTTLKTATAFAMGHIGVAGTISETEIALRALLKQPDAVAQCQKLLAEATPEGQCYALLGLSLTDRAAFLAALPRWRNSKKDITTIGGCMIMPMPANQVVANIEKGLYK